MQITKHAHCVMGTAHCAPGITYPGYDSVRKNQPAGTTVAPLSDTQGMRRSRREVEKGPRARFERQLWPRSRTYISIGVLKTEGQSQADSCWRESAVQVWLSAWANDPKSSWTKVR